MCNDAILTSPLTTHYAEWEAVALLIASITAVRRLHASAGFEVMVNFNYILKDELYAQNMQSKLSLTTLSVSEILSKN